MFREKLAMEKLLKFKTKVDPWRVKWVHGRITFIKNTRRKLKIGSSPWKIHYLNWLEPKPVIHKPETTSRNIKNDLKNGSNQPFLSFVLSFVRDLYQLIIIKKWKNWFVRLPYKLSRMHHLRVHYGVRNNWLQLLLHWIQISRNLP